MSDQNLKLQIILNAVEKVTTPFRRVQAQSKAVTAEVKTLRDKLRQLDTTAAKMDQYRHVAEQAGKTGHAMTQAQERVKQLKAAIEATGKPTRELVKDFAAAQKEANGLASKHAELIERQTKLAGALKESGIETGNLAEHQRDFRSQIEEVNAALSVQQERLAGVNERLRQQKAAQATYQKRRELAGKLATTGAGALAAGYVLAKATTAPLHAFADLDKASNNLSVAMLDRFGKVPAAFAEINKQAIVLGNRLPGTTADFVNTATALLENGTRLKDVTGGGLKAAANLSVVLKQPAAEAAEMVAKLREAYGLTSNMPVKAGELTELEKMANLVQQAKFAFGLDASEIRYAAQYYGTALNALHLTGAANAKAMLAFQGYARQKGMEGSVFGTNFSSMMTQIGQLGEKLGRHSKVMKEVNADLAQYGIKLKFFEHGKFIGLEGLMGQLAQLRKVTDEQKLGLILNKAFGAEGARVATIGMQMGPDGFRESLAQMDKQASLTQRIDLVTQSAKNTWEAFTGTVTNVLAALGAPLAQALLPLVRQLNDFVGGPLQSWIERHQTLVKWLGVGALALAGFMAVFGGLLLAVAGILGPLAALRFGLQTIGIELAANAGAWGILRAAIGVMMSPLKAVWGALGTVFSALRGLAVFFAANPLLLALMLIGAAAAYVWANWDSIGPKFRALWQGIKQAAGAAWDWISDKAHAIAQGVANLFMRWTLPGILYSHWDGIKAYFRALPAQFLAFGGMVMDGLVNGITAGLGRVKTAITGAGENTVKWFKEKLGIHSPSRVFAALGGHTMDGLALGLDRSQRGPLAIMQALTRELTRPIAGAVALGASLMAPAANTPIDSRPPLARSASAMQAPAPLTVHITIHAAPGMDERALAKAVADEIARQQRSQAAGRRSRLADRD